MPWEDVLNQMRLHSKHTWTHPQYGIVAVGLWYASNSWTFWRGFKNLHIYNDAPAIYQRLIEIMEAYHCSIYGWEIETDFCDNFGHLLRIWYRASANRAFYRTFRMDSQSRASFVTCLTFFSLDLTTSYIFRRRLPLSTICQCDTYESEVWRLPQVVEKLLSWSEGMGQCWHIGYTCIWASVAPWLIMVFESLGLENAEMAAWVKEIGHRDSKSTWW